MRMAVGANAIGACAALSLLSSVATGVECAYVAAPGLRSVVIIDLDKSEVADVIPAGERPTAVRVGDGGREVYVSDSVGGNLSVLETATNRIVATFAVGGEPVGLAVSPDGGRVYVANRSSHDVAVVDSAARRVVGRIGTGAGAAAIVVNAAGTVGYAANQSGGSITRIDLTTNLANGVLSVGAGVFFLDLTPAEEFLWVSNVATGEVVVVETGTFRISDTLPLGGFPSDITVHPDGARVFVPNVPVDGSLSVVDVATREVVESFVVEEFGALGGSALSADGTTLFISEFALGNVFVIDLASYTVREFISVGGGSGLEGLDVADLPQGCRRAGCPGDCDADGEVRIAELVLAVNIALNRSDSRQCLNADIDGDGAVSIAELVRMVNAALRGCGSATAG